MHNGRKITIFIQEITLCPNLKRWFESIRERPAVTEEGKKFLFGHTVATIQNFTGPQL